MFRRPEAGSTRPVLDSTAARESQRSALRKTSTCSTSAGSSAFELLWAKDRTTVRAILDW